MVGTDKYITIWLELISVLQYGLRCKCITIWFELISVLQSGLS